MSATLWIDTSKEQTIELGNTIACYKSFDEMSDITDKFEEEYTELSQVPDQTMHTDDCDPTWLKRVRQQAGSFLSEYRDRLSGNTVWVLEQLVQS